VWRTWWAWGFSGTLDPPPTGYKRDRDGERVVNVHGGFIVPVGGVEGFDDEQVVTDKGEGQPRDRDECVMGEGVTAQFAKRDPCGDDGADRGDDPADEVRWGDEEQENAENVADEPEEDPPTEGVACKVFVHDVVVVALDAQKPEKLCEIYGKLFIPQSARISTTLLGPTRLTG